MTEFKDDGSDVVAPTGKELLRESWNQLKAGRGVAALPLLGVLAALVAFFIFVGPGFAVGALVPDENTRSVIMVAAVVVGGFAATLAVTVFQGAVVSAAFQQSLGESTSLPRAMSGALNRLGRLLQWGLVVATVNLLLSLLRDRKGTVNGIISIAGGLAWSVATYLALPAVMFEGIGPFSAIKRSSALITQTWGSALRVTVRFGLVLVPFILVGVALFGGGVYLMIEVHEVLGISLIALSLVVLLVVMTFTSTVTAYVKTQLYLYASGQNTSVASEIVRGAVQVA